jgi:hypothetical protein
MVPGDLDFGLAKMLHFNSGAQTIATAWLACQEESARDDLLIYDCFQARARILNPFVGVPSNQPHLAGLV